MTEQSKREKADKAIEVINAWADGEDVQFSRGDSDGWWDIGDELPHFASVEWRIKPKTRYILHFGNLYKDSKSLGYVFNTKESALNVMREFPSCYSHIEEIPNE
jgi:hypothetical protein